MPPRKTTTKAGSNGAADTGAPPRPKGARPNPSNCPGSGRPWASGGRCQECGITARALEEGGVQARRGDNLAPRVPIHTGDVPDARKSADSSVLNGVSTPRTPPRTPPRRKAPVTVQAPPKPTSTRSRRQAAVPDEPKETSKGAARAVRDPLQKEFTSTITDYLAWLRKTIEAGGLNWDKMPRERLAGLAISMYGKWQSSDERRSARTNWVRKV